MKRAQDLGPRARILWLLALVLIAYFVLLGRLVYWQGIRHRDLTQLASEYHDDVITLPAVRGRIFDRKGVLLATNTPVYSVFGSPDQISAADRPAMAAQLAAVLGMDQAEVAERLASPRKFVYLKRRVSAEAAEQLEKLRLPGIGKLQETQRTFLDGALPASTLAATLLGFVNADGKGNYGLEGYYDALLAGRAGFEATVKDLTNRPIVLSDRRREEPIDGSSLQLSIDSAIQLAAERALADGVKKSKGESGSLMIMEPKTGRIVAWADFPTYDANQYAQVAQAHPEFFTDANVAHLYEPGSIMKVVTLSGALDAHVITPETSFNETGSVVVGGAVFRNWDYRAHGWVSMTYVLQNSLNVGAIKAMQMEGADRFYQSLQRFGIGDLTGIDLAGETRAPLRELSQWRPSEVATATFGQGVAVTPIEMLTAINVIASGGDLVWPHVVDQITDSRGQVRPVHPRVIRHVIAPQTAQQMRQMMVAVVERGSGFAARIDGFKDRVAGKTSTAEIPENGRYGDDVNAAFVGFLPVNNPQFTMMVIVRKPKVLPRDLREGAYVAAPIWKTVATSLITQWNIGP